MGGRPDGPPRPPAGSRVAPGLACRREDGVGGGGGTAAAAAGGGPPGVRRKFGASCFSAPNFWEPGCAPVVRGDRRRGNRLSHSALGMLTASERGLQRIWRMDLEVSGLRQLFTSLDAHEEEEG